MSILDTSVSGMIANTNWLTTIAQNVANANTTGYKNVETQFSALVDTSQNLDSQFGGVTTTTRALNSLQGQNQETSTTTDLAQLAQFEFGFGDFASGGVSQIKWLDG